MIGGVLRLGMTVVVLVFAWRLIGPTAPELMAALAQAGMGAVVVMAAVHAVPVVLCGLAWSRLLPGAPARLLVFVRWIRDAFNELLGLLPLAGEAASLRLLGRAGVKSGPGAAAIVGDLTAEVVAQVAFSLIGLALWAGHRGADEIQKWGVMGVLGGAGVAAAFVGVQHAGGVRLLEGMAARVLPDRWFSGDPADGIHANLMALYRQRRGFIAAFALHLLAWVAACAEALVALRLLGNPISPIEAVMLESAVFALRSAAFTVPGALGVQEGAYALLAPLLGLSPATAVTVSLLKRGREVLMGVPAVLVWTLVSRRLRPSARGASPSSDRR